MICENCNSTNFSEATIFNAKFTQCSNCGKVYQLTSSPELEQFNEESKKAIEERKHPTITCPYCQSTDTKKITTTGRMFSMGFFGLASGKVGKQWHCNKCKSDF